MSMPPSRGLDRCVAGIDHGSVGLATELIRDVARAVLGGAIAFLVALLPERWKQGRLAAYADPRMHALSGIAEIAAGAIFFITGMLAFAHRFGDYIYTYAATAPQTKMVELLGMGALAYVSYLITPAAWIFIYLFVEGIARALEVAFHGRMPGLGVLHLGMRAADVLRLAERKLRHRFLVGAPWPDHLIEAASHPQGLLEIRAAAPKPWSEKQVLERGGVFYTMVGSGFGRRGENHAHWYLFRELEEREVIRGVIVSYPDAASPAGEAQRRKEAAAPFPAAGDDAV